MNDQGLDAALNYLDARHAAAFQDAAGAEDSDLREEAFIIADGIAGAMSRFSATSLDGVRAKIAVASRHAAGRPALDVLRSGSVQERHLIASVMDDLFALQHRAESKTSEQ